MENKPCREKEEEKRLKSKETDSGCESVKEYQHYRDAVNLNKRAL